MALQTLRVLHVINQVCGRGGAEVSLRENILASVGSDLDQAVVVLDPMNNVIEPFDAVGVPVYVPERTLSRVGAVRYVRAAARRFRPHLVHSSLFDADLAARFAAIGTRTPVVCSVVNTEYGELAVATEPVSAAKLRAAKALDGILARHATSAFHPISEATAVHAVEHLRVPRTRIRVVPRGRDEADFGERTPEMRQRVREEFGWVGRQVVLNVARQEPQKGHEHLVRAFCLVLAAHPDALLVQVGREGRSTQATRLLVERLGIDGSVQFLGVRTDVSDLLLGADVFGFSSLWEGLGGAVVEAAAASLPIIAFEVPAIREIVGPSHPWLVPIGDTAALGEMLVEAIEADDVIVQRVTAEARRRFLAHYELQAVAQGMEKLYRDVLADIGRRRPGLIRKPPVVQGRMDLFG